MNVRPPKGEDLSVSDPEDIFRIMQKVLLRQNKVRRQKEYFWIIGLSTANDIQFIELSAIGGLNKVGVRPADLFRIAVIKGCKSVVLVHNHPSGHLKPSTQDKDLTRRLMKAGEILDIEVLDHIIITENNYCSFINELK